MQRSRRFGRRARQGQSNSMRGGSVFRFSMNPAALGITEGIQDAFAYLQQTWRMVVARGDSDRSVLVRGVCNRRVNRHQHHLSRRPGHESGRLEPGCTREGRRTVCGSHGSHRPCGIDRKLGLQRGRDRWPEAPSLTISWIVTRGLVTVLAGIVVGVACVLAVVVLALVTVAVPPLGVILILVAIPVGIYFAICLVFYSWRSSTASAPSTGFGRAGDCRTEP